MKEFTPPLSARSDVELIIIAFSSTKEWQIEAIKQAKFILKERGFSRRDQIRKFEDITRQQQGGWKMEMDRRKVEDYTAIDIIFMFLNLPKTILHDWYLRKEGYKLKAKRRLQVIFIGLLFIFLLGLYANLTYDKREEKRLQEIEAIDISDWKKEHGYE